jgi:outer membrane protein TolC
VGRAEARGARLQRAAAYRQSTATERDLAARAASGVAVASQALSRSAAELAEAEQAVELYRATVENERQKNRLGASTLFDVLYAEDNLTSAMLGVVAGRQGYARAFAALRYETGTLVQGEGTALRGSSPATPP